MVQAPSGRFFARLVSGHMTDRDRPQKTPKPADERAARLKAALKANMAKRKAQARARATPKPKDAES